MHVPRWQGTSAELGGSNRAISSGEEEEEVVERLDVRKQDQKEKEHRKQRTLLIFKRNCRKPTFLNYKPQRGCC